MKLYLVQCGFYDKAYFNSFNEFHVNFLTVGDGLEPTKQIVRSLPEFAGKQMHIDGIQEIEVVNGYRIELKPLKCQDEHQHLGGNSSSEKSNDRN